MMDMRTRHARPDATSGRGRCWHTMRPAFNRTAGRVAATAGSGGGAIVREVLQRQDRLKMDTTSDRQFYEFPRLVKHVDERFLSQLTELYRQRIPEGGAVLDLMSSWVSHLPPEARYSKVVGHGMNAAELARNPRLDTFFVRNLNEDPDGWSAQEQSFDAVICCVSVQYMQQPERVFAEIYRVLKPGGVVIMSFSNRMFYTKAIQAWRDATDYGRLGLVKQYFMCVQGFTEPEVVKGGQLGASSGSSAQQQQQGGGSLLDQLKDQLQSLLGSAGSDPFYAVVAYRDFKP